MEDDHDSLECRECQMEAMAHYADVLEHDAAHSEVTGHDHFSQMIMDDAVDYCTPDDDRWLGLITELISTRRLVASRTLTPVRKFRLYRGRHRR